MFTLNPPKCPPTGPVSVYLFVRIFAVECTYYPPGAGMWGVASPVDAAGGGLRRCGWHVGRVSVLSYSDALLDALNSKPEYEARNIIREYLNDDENPDEYVNFVPNSLFYDINTFCKCWMIRSADSNTELTLWMVCESTSFSLSWPLIDQQDWTLS